MQFFTPKGFQLLFDLLRFCLWANKTDEPIVGVTTVSEASEVGVMGID
jgi:hypothetical protein